MLGFTFHWALELSLGNGGGWMDGRLSDVLNNSSGKNMYTETDEQGRSRSGESLITREMNKTVYPFHRHATCSMSWCLGLVVE